MRSNAESTGASSDTGARVVTALAVLEPTTSATGHTLGSVAMAMPPSFDRRRRLTVTVAAFFGTLVLAVSVAMMWTRSTRAVTASGASQAALPLPSSEPSVVAPAAPPTGESAWDTVPTAESTSPSAAPPTGAPAPVPQAGRHTSHGVSTATVSAPPKPPPTTKQRENYGF
jgi:hypothetical protein